MSRLTEIDALKEKYGELYIEEIHRTYDNDMYLLISGKFFSVIECVVNSNFEHNVQEFRLIENIHSSNKSDFEHFKELDIVDLPKQSV